jgi:hypothetical protein
MQLFDQAVEFNRQISEFGLKDNFQNENGLRSILASYDNKCLLLEDIAFIAKSIVTMQCFKDGNHRTAVAMCYRLALNHNLLLRIKPHLLYAAIDYEYFFTQLEDHLLLTAPNAILQAIQSRVVKTQLHPNFPKEKYFQAIMARILEIPGLLEKTTAEDYSSKQNNIRKKQFETYLGYTKQGYRCNSRRLYDDIIINSSPIGVTEIDSTTPASLSTASNDSSFSPLSANNFFQPIAVPMTHALSSELIVSTPN